MKYNCLPYLAFAGRKSCKNRKMGREKEKLLLTIMQLQNDIKNKIILNNLFNAYRNQSTKPGTEHDTNANVMNDVTEKGFK